MENFLLCLRVMETATDVEIWVPETPMVVFMVPAHNSYAHAAAMSQMTTVVLRELGRPVDSMETIGLISATAEQGAEGILFLDEMGLDPRNIILLVLWGETSDAAGFGNSVAPDCGVGFIALTKSGVVIPAVRMPSIEDGWWEESLHQEYAIRTYSDLIKDGRQRPESRDHTVFVGGPAAWN